MSFLSSENFIRRALPAWYIFMSLFAIIEIGTSGYLVGKGSNGGDYGGSLRSAVRFALFTGLWTFLFGLILAIGTFKRMKFINTGFAHFIYLAITLIFWIAVGASLQSALNGSGYDHRTTIRATEWIGWIEAIFHALTFPWVLLGVSHAKEGIRGSVAV
ncbi:hypothetical protein P389DRAFT_170495 [Cystobasidium minutum MCA 4210]|uniref:uncharacterized protein n=1 Tax=Cystobasidium minutum MCA 4210 TaxID=1397322 RepID=UPI0034CDCC01|eukprot:jgi/Rhomi1/170495/fgenesh1_kg.4_\